MRGAECEPVAIFFRSVPQIPQVCTRRSNSPGPIAGTGTVSRRTSFTPRYTAASMVAGTACSFSSIAICPAMAMVESISCSAGVPPAYRAGETPALRVQAGCGKLILASSAGMQARFRFSHFFGRQVVLFQPSAKSVRCLVAVPREPKHPEPKPGTQCDERDKGRSAELPGTGDELSERRHLKIGFVGNGFEPNECDVVCLGAPGHRCGFHIHGVRPVRLRQLGFLLHADRLINADQNPM